MRKENVQTPSEDLHVRDVVQHPSHPRFRFCRTQQTMKNQIYIYTYYIIIYIHNYDNNNNDNTNMYMCVCCNMFQTLRSCFMFWAELLHRWKISGDWKPCFRSLFPLQQALCENKAMQLAKLSAVRPKLSTKASLPLNGKFAKHLISRSQLQKSWPRIQGKTIETDENVHEVRYPLSLTFIHFHPLSSTFHLYRNLQNLHKNLSWNKGLNRSRPPCCDNCWAVSAVRKSNQTIARQRGSPVTWTEQKGTKKEHNTEAKERHIALHIALHIASNITFTNLYSQEPGSCLDMDGYDSLIFVNPHLVPSHSCLPLIRDTWQQGVSSRESASVQFSKGRMQLGSVWLQCLAVRVVVPT